MKLIVNFDHSGKYFGSYMFVFVCFHWIEMKSWMQNVKVKQQLVAISKEMAF